MNFIEAFVWIFGISCGSLFVVPLLVVLVISVVEELRK